MNKEEDQPIRYIACVMGQTLVDVVGTAAGGMGGDVIDVLILAFVASESTRAMLEDRHLAQHYGYEARIMPDDERKPTSVREICEALHMKRETVRRRLVRLEAGGWLRRVDGGFIQPAQTGEDDKMKTLRPIIVRHAGRLVRELQRAPMP